MPTVDDHGFPNYTDTEAMPDWDGYANTLGTALGEALDDAAQAEKDNDSVATIAALPVTGNWPGRQVMVEENDMIYMHDGTGWYIIGGKKPYFFGSRTSADVLADTSQQAYITAEDSSRGVSFAAGVMTFETPGIYQVVETVAWEPNGAGQRNLGILGTGITVMGPAEVYDVPAGVVTVAQTFSTFISVSAPGATATPYVTHNSGATLAVGGHVCVTWWSA